MRSNCLKTGLLIFIACYFLITLKAQKSFLDKEIKISCNTNSIEYFLDEITKEGKVEFSYTSKVPVYRIVTISKPKQSIRSILTEILQPDSIRFIERNNKILLIAERPRPAAKTNLSVNYIQGVVLDKRTRKPLPYANIFIVDKSMGTISNAAGAFLLKFNDISPEDTLGVSYIGYRLFRMPLFDIDTNFLTIRLSSDQVQIDEIIVRPYDPIYIITKAIESIPDNYESEASVLTAFFRESTKQNDDNISLSEAVIHIYKESYTSSRPDQVKIYKGRKGNNIANKENIDFIVQGGLYNNLQLDIIKNGIAFLDKDYFHLYDYAVERIIYHQERPTYVISFDQREGVSYPCYKGKLYIDIESLAIIGANFELSQEGINYATGLYVKKSPRKLKVRPVSASYQVYYRQYNNRWNLSNARSVISIRVKHKKNKSQDKLNYMFESISEFVITGIDSSNTARFKFKEISRPRDILVRQIKETDESFWGDENIIIPEESIEKTILRLWKKDRIQFDQSFAIRKINDTIPSQINHDKR
ncbi:MAG: carboxypeptidase-like regulatory domain-containing protein [Bacteroidales bacterium]|nr:carboxypeptidase-like regulatory domain-containing protein [Bacteroidales bacterium]